MQHGDDGGEDLNQELRPRAQGDDVVDHAGDDDDDGSEQNAAHLLRDVREQEHRHDEAQKDGQTAHAGDGMVVHAPGLAGTSMAPSFCARILTTGVSAKLTTNAMRIASMTLIQTAVLRNMRTDLQ